MQGFHGCENTGMDTFEALREDIGLVAASLASYSHAVSTHADAVDSAVKELWADNAELRDELHAVANRLENLTRAITTEPAEVAEQIVSRSRWQACDECGTAIRRGVVDGLIYDREGLHTCRESERRIVAGAE